MDADEWFKRIAPFNLFPKWFQHLRLPLSQNRKWLNYSVTQSFEEFWRACLDRFENVACELAVVRALLKKDKIVYLTELLPDLSELRRHQSPEKQAYAHVSEIVALPPDCTAARGIVSVLGMVKRLFHEPGE